MTRDPDDFAKVVTIPKPALEPTSENFFDALATAAKLAAGNRMGTASFKVGNAAKLNEIAARARDEYPGDPDHDPSAQFIPDMED